MQIWFSLMAATPILARVPTILVCVSERGCPFLFADIIQVVWYFPISWFGLPLCVKPAVPSELFLIVN